MTLLKLGLIRFKSKYFGLIELWIGQKCTSLVQLQTQDVFVALNQLFVHSNQATIIRNIDSILRLKLHLCSNSDLFPSFASFGKSGKSMTMHRSLLSSSLHSVY